MTMHNQIRVSNLALDHPIVTHDDDGMRLDRWLKRRFSMLTQGHIQKLLRTGQVRVEGKRAKASDRLAEGQEIRLPPQLVHGNFAVPVNEGKTNHPIRQATRMLDWVLYEDDDVVALNKPAGLAVQGGTGLKENLDDSLMVFSRNGKTKPKLVHRLDRDTSGVLLIARNDTAARKLTAAFRDRATQKIYWAVTVGVPKRREGRIDTPLLKKGEIMVLADHKKNNDAKSAVTLYRVRENAKRLAAFVELLPLTGRTHQLRVHMASLDTPILGDRLYGGEWPESLPKDELGKGLHLHARRLIVPHPRYGKIDVTAPLSHNMLVTWRWFGFGTSD